MKIVIVLLISGLVTGCVSVKPSKREDAPKLLRIEGSQLTMASRVARKGSPSLMVWSYTANKPLWSIVPKQKKMKGNAPLSFAYAEVPTGYLQRYPSEAGMPVLPAKGDVVIFLLVFTHETLFAPTGSNFAVAYTYDGINQWQKVAVPEDAYTPEGW